MKIGAALLRIIEVIGPDKIENIDEDTVYFIINTLNQLNVDLIRNKLLLKSSSFKSIKIIIKSSYGYQNYNNRT